MLSIIGIVLVFGAAIGALGTLLVANPLPIIIGIFKSVPGVMGGRPYSKSYYLECLKMLNDIFQFARRASIAVEFARSAIPHDVRPGFQEMEAACKGGGAAAAEAKAAQRMVKPIQPQTIMIKRASVAAGGSGGTKPIAAAGSGAVATSGAGNPSRFRRPIPWLPARRRSNFLRDQIRTIKPDFRILPIKSIICGMALAALSGVQAV